MSVKLTSEQQQAIASRGKVIVSASAGSGKTFVMIERLVSLILEGTDVRRILAVTYTNKAAAQMRDRLRAALIKRIGTGDESARARLKEQLSALPLADICTVHSFCARLVRSYFWLADADPAFRIISGEDREGAALSARALDEVFEQAYEERGEDFLRLLGVWFRSKKDAYLRGLVVSLYGQMRMRADYRVLLAQMGQEDRFEETAEFLAEEVRETARFVKAHAEEQRVFYAAAGKASAVKTCEKLLLAAEQLTDGDFYTLAAREIPTVPPKPRGTEGLEVEIAEAYAYTGKLSGALKRAIALLKDFSDRETQHARYTETLALVRALAALVLKFDETFTRIKREEGVLDYNDLEHLALEVLSREEARSAVREKYSFVFVDEYQDVNPAQERILSLVSGEEVFLVGDAKQSIYGFRGSRSEFFVKKCSEFGALALTENFRSAPAVLDAVNRVFSYAMTEEVCGIGYASAPMRGGSRYAGHEGRVCFHTIPKDPPKEKQERGVYSVLTKARSKPDEQAALLCALIEQEVGSEWYDADAGCVKKLGFGDIAVLVRSDNSETERLLAALGEKNIPVVTTAKVNICAYWEVRLLIDWLSFLDNAEQDIPLAGAMLSRAGGFTDGELARIRARFPSAPSFRAACYEYSEKMRDDVCEKLHTFYQKTQIYRALAQVRTAAEMMDLLLAEGLEAEIAAKREGTFRLRRARRFVEEAEGSTGDFLRRLKATGYKVKDAEGGGENAVRLLTMHTSKGLEFPVVFLVNLDTAFHGSERDEVLCTDRFLFAPKSYDTEARVVRDNLLRRASLLYEDRETVKAELNLLYVSMTRAKYRLHLLVHDRDRALSPRFAERMSDFIDFGSCGALFAPPPAVLPPALSRTALAYEPDGTLLSSFRAAYQAAYPFEESTRLPVKSSATDLLRMMKQDAPARFETTGEGGTVEEGLAYHAFLQHVRFGAPVEEELARMGGEGTLTKEELSLLDPEKLRHILALPSLAGLGGKRLWREQTFLALLPARALLPVLTDDEIVFQGAIDLLCEDEQGFLILDYKYSAHSAERLKETYAPQIALYRKAVAKTMRVDERTVRARIVNILGLFETEM